MLEGRPGGGDLATGLLASYIVAEAAKLGVPRRTLWRMVANVAIDMAGVQTGLPTAQLSATLMMLELKRLIVKRADGTFEAR